MLIVITQVFTWFLERHWRWLRLSIKDLQWLRIEEFSKNNVHSSYTGASYAKIKKLIGFSPDSPALPPVPDSLTSSQSPTPLYCSLQELFIHIASRKHVPGWLSAAANHSSAAASLYRPLVILLYSPAWLLKFENVLTSELRLGWDPICQTSRLQQAGSRPYSSVSYRHYSESEHLYAVTSYRDA